MLQDHTPAAAAKPTRPPRHLKPIDCDKIARQVAEARRWLKLPRIDA